MTKCRDIVEDALWTAAMCEIICKSPIESKLKDAILGEFDRRFGYVEHSFLLAAYTLLSDESIESSSDEIKKEEIDL